MAPPEKVGIKPVFALPLKQRGIMSNENNTLNESYAPSNVTSDLLTPSRSLSDHSLIDSAPSSVGVGIGVTDSSSIDSTPVTDPSASASSIDPSGSRSPSQSQSQSARQRRQIELAKESAFYGKLLKQSRLERATELSKLAHWDQTRVSVRRGFSVSFQNQLATLVNPLPDAIAFSNRHDTANGAATSATSFDAASTAATHARLFADDPLNMYLLPSTSIGSPSSRSHSVRPPTLTIYERDIMRRKLKEHKLQSQTEAARRKAEERIGRQLDTRDDERSEKRPVIADGAYLAHDEGERLLDEEEKAIDQARQLITDSNGASTASSSSLVTHHRPRPRSRSTPSSIVGKYFTSTSSIPIAALSPSIRLAQYQEIHSVSQLKRMNIAEIDSTKLIGEFKYIAIKK